MRASSKFHSLQALRAIAAWLVVIDHALLELSHNDPRDWVTHVGWMLGSLGVYIFFVISGFIMAHICWDSFGRPAATADFLKRRLIRIVPLYWLATIAALAYHRVSETHGAHAGWSDLVQSLAFIPYLNGDGSWTPILPQGWTLGYEMMFYGVFAGGLLLPRGIALPAIGAALAALVLVGPLQPDATVAYLASPIVLWFPLGMALAIAWYRLNLMEPVWIAKLARPLEPFGDASYSTYLSHGVVLTMLLRAWTMFVGPPSIWLVPTSLLAATAVGWAIHQAVERPLLRFAVGIWKSGPRIPVNLKASGAAPTPYSPRPPSAPCR
jgi:peptidoglycan/LPS O-acetylase OafA/YrhL